MYYLRYILTGIFLMNATSCASQVSDRIKSSPNFREGTFRNTGISRGKSFWKFLKMRMNSDWAEWPEWIEIKEGPRPVDRVEGSEIRVTFINHATLLIQTEGYNILTDPIWSKRCSPVSFAGPSRVHKPAISFESLPEIDVVIISHDHYDHLDLDTIEKLQKRDDPKFYVGLGVRERFENKSKVIELDWWESELFADDFKVNFVEVQHFSGRTLTDRNTTLWGGFVLEVGKRKIYFGGDSGYGGHYKKTFERFGAMDLSFLPIGAYAPRDFMGPMHVDPKEAVLAHFDLKSKQSFGMHYGTFQLTAEDINEPVNLLKSEAAAAGLTRGEFDILDLGIPFIVK